MLPHAHSDPAEVCTRVVPLFPAASPYVTAVGATQTSTDANVNLVEVVCSIETGALITSGGGFSAIDPMPDYQAAAVNQYFANPPADMPSNFTNTRGCKSGAGMCL